MSRKRVYLGCFVLHFSLILAVCCRETLGLLAQGHTIFGSSLAQYWRKAESITSLALGEELAASNPVREAREAYTHSAGIEGGYGFFAPNIPNNYKLVFELHYNDGRIEYALPQVRNTATGLRLAALLDEIGHVPYEALRELMLRMLTYSTWREHPDAIMIRAVFGFVDLPSVEDFERGKKESYEFLYAYDFSFRVQPRRSQTP